jgi:hypothetical protein
MHLLIIIIIISTKTANCYTLVETNAQYNIATYIMMMSPAG